MFAKSLFRLSHSIWKHWSVRNESLDSFGSFPIRFILQNESSWNRTHPSLITFSHRKTIEFWIPKNLPNATTDPICFQTKWLSLNWSWLPYNVLGDIIEQILQSVVRRFQGDGTRRTGRPFRDRIVSIITQSFTKTVTCFPCLVCRFGRLGCTIWGIVLFFTYL